MATPTAIRHGASERGAAPDVAGAALLSCCAVWALVSAAGRAARPEGTLLALLAVTAGYACGRIAGSLLPVAAATAGALAGAALTVAPEQAASTGGVTVDAARLTLATGAACCAAWAAGPGPPRRALWLLAGALAALALTAGCAAGFVAACGVLLCSLAAGRVRHRLPALAGLALVAALAVGSTWAVAANALPRGLATSLEGQLTEHRVRLWHDAATITAEHPLRGAGPDLFGEVSPASRQSAEPHGTPYSAPMQQAAEQGLPGVALLAAAFGWTLYALWRSPRATAVALTAAAALTGLAVQAAVGNALSSPQITAGAGLLAGLATARRPGAPIESG
ncbi:O-antigen ligase [Streptomyces sp. SAJ15]|uniref:O-antigen ligase family protein n=1 Tax=Streptomyces sp. SAJ15 TaxID=2011095 RepID=UPI001185EF89|nr:O-antigen ligase family protein [Streptomyces sp. SAJ15]TVL93346.1 O-antigen polymerase [Streptomyces sp. SAJ15]